MKRPSMLQFILGNPLVGLALFAAACVVWVRWWNGQAATVGAVLMLFVVVIAGDAFDKVTDYQEKQREWKALAGEPITRGISMNALKKLRILLAILLWGGMAWLAWRERNDPDMKYAVWAFAAGSVLGFANLLWRFRPRRMAKPKQWKDVPVTQCLPGPSGSPPAAHAAAALPPAMAALLRPVSNSAGTAGSGLAAESRSRR